MAWASKIGRPIERKEAMIERASTLQLGQFGQPYVRGWDIERALADGYDRVMWVFRCIDAIASNAAMLPIILREGNEDRGEPITDHPALTMMNQKANIFETADVFWYRLFSQYLMSKKGVFVEVRYNRGGDPVEMYLLPPQWTWPIPDKDEFVSAYRVQIPGGNGFVDVPAYDKNGLPKIIWIRKPHPLDPYMGVTPLESAGLSIDIDFYARLYNRSFLQNDGRPGGVIAVKGELDPKDAEELRRRHSQGPAKAGAISVIEADEVSYVDMAVNPRDAQYIEGRKGTKEEILLAFGVPESILGNAANRTYDNADAEKYVFWQETMQFHLRLVAGFFDFFTDIDFSTMFDTSGIGVLRRDREQEEDHDKGLVITGLMTIDEFRDKHGRDKFNTPSSRALWLPNNLVAQPAEGDEDHFAPIAPAVPGHPASAAPDALPNVNAPKPSPPSALGKPPAALPAPAADGTSKSVVRPKGGSASADRNSIINQAEKQRARWEKKSADVASALFKRQRKVVLAKVKGTKARKGTRHWVNEDGRSPVVTKVLNVDDVFDEDRWNSEWESDFDDLGQQIYSDTADDVADDFDQGDNFNSSDAEVAAAIAALTGKHAAVAAQANETTKSDIARMMAENESDDRDIDALDSDLNDYFDNAESADDGRASNIGTWFAVGAIAAGAMFATKYLFGDSGDGGGEATDEDGNPFDDGEMEPITKGWVSMRDGGVRSTHVAADGDYSDSDSAIPIDEKFSIGDSELSFPGDPEGDINETANCRCVLVFYKGDQELKNLRRRQVKDREYVRDDHGRFGSGSGDTPVSDSLFDRAKEGGFTYHPTSASSPATGVCVARDGTSHIIPADKFFESRASAKTYVADYLKEHRDEFKGESAHLGGWHDAEHNEFVLDISDVYQDRDEAIKVGQERNQQAVFDLATLEEIPTGGTGGREDENQHRGKSTDPTDRDAKSGADGPGHREDRGGDGGRIAVRLLQELTRAVDGLKFDETDVVRDDHGRFSTTGGSGASGAEDGLGQPKIPGTDTNGKTVDFTERGNYVDKQTSVAVNNGHSTDQIYDGKDREGHTVWSPDRVAVHNAILNDVYAGAAHVPNNGQAIITGGLPGSGKSSGLATAFDSHLLDGSEKEYLTLNPDIMKEELANRGLIPDEKTDPVLAGLSPMEKAALIHEESSYLTSQLAERAYADRKNVLWDITMNSRGSVEKRLNALDAGGYEKQMIFTEATIETAASRAAGRYERGQAGYENGTNTLGGRFVSSSIGAAKVNDEWGTENRAVYESLKDRADKFVAIDTNGQPPKIIEKS